MNKSYLDSVILITVAIVLAHALIGLVEQVIASWLGA